MTRKTRVTTSVSTLVNDIHSLIQVAHAGGRKDLLKVCAGLLPRVNAFTVEYVNLRKEIDPLKKAFLKSVSVTDILSTLNEVDEDQGKVEENEVVEANA